MTLAAIQAGLYFPVQSLPFAANNGTLDATGEKYAAIGYLHINGRPSSAKTLSTGTIQFRTGACTFANGSTTMDVGIQGVSTSAGLIAQPDGSYSVKKTLTGGAGITGDAWNTVTMNSGTVNLTHGQLVAVVFDMTNRAGADSVLVSGSTLLHSNHTMGLPITNAFVSSAWQTGQSAGAGRHPNIIIVFDDGSIGWLDGSVPTSTFLNDNAEQFSDATNPDERGMIFQVPWDCNIDALWSIVGITDIASDFTIALYSAPTTSASIVSGTSTTVLAEQCGISTGDTNFPYYTFPLAAEVSLSKNTDYCVAIRANGASTKNIVLSAIVLGNEAYRIALPGGTTLKKATRNNGSGNFTAENPAVTIYEMGIRISQFHDGAGSGGGARVIGG